MLRNAGGFRTGVDALKVAFSEVGFELKRRGELRGQEELDGVPGGRFCPQGVWAQVAERLMAADCKSAAPWSYGGSNPPLCTTDVRGWNGK
jgi:hypothetical protein